MTFFNGTTPGVQAKKLGEMIDTSMTTIESLHDVNSRLVGLAAGLDDEGRNEVKTTIHQLGQTITYFEIRLKMLEMELRSVEKQLGKANGTTDSPGFSSLSL